jgi:hypothetical protein
MEEFDRSSGEMRRDIGWMTPVLVFTIFVLTLFTSMATLMRLAQTGPDIGEAVVFDPRNGPRYWEQPGFLVSLASSTGGPARTCVLTPSIMAAGEGRLVLEAKEMTRPPMYRAHWAGGHTDRGGGDCGVSADLILQLSQVRALARIAGGWGMNRGTLFL